MNNNLKYNCIFGGGGIRGMCYIGAVEALKEFNIEIDSIAGSSVGAVFASLFAAGCSIDEIKELFFEFNMNMFRDININLFSADISISKGEIFYEWVREKIGKKFFGENYSKSDERKVTFKDLKKDLNILTIDINTNTPFIFSKKNTPDVEIAFAVRASASLPGLMKPVNYNHTMLVDGDLIKSWPAWKIYSDFNNSSSRILEFRLEGSKDGT
ncbi:MAG: patatin-like phospholipase family protein, partial [Candidatus Gastranaerophilales bacterium]|nr:patatin-like phospholipase family protein [Candidatus Gastranaerophilales bacterium]